MKDLHKYQAAILKKFIFQKELGYSEMKPTKTMENNKFQFHLDKLKEIGLLEKIGDKYKLTKEGKKITGRMDSKKAIIRQQMKVGVGIIATRDKNNAKEYLIFTRLKIPFFECQGFMAGKVELGEKIIDAARREFNEETQLDGTPVMVGTNHYLTKQNGETVDDLLLFFCWINNPTGKLKGSKEGKYEWVSEANLEKYITKTFQDKEKFFKEIALVKDFQGSTSIHEIEWEDKGGASF